jgi:hypothetical protein
MIDAACRAIAASTPTTRNKLYAPAIGSNG